MPALGTALVASSICVCATAIGWEETAQSASAPLARHLWTLRKEISMDRATYRRNRRRSWSGATCTCREQLRSSRQWWTLVVMSCPKRATRTPNVPAQEWATVPLVNVNALTALAEERARAQRAKTIALVMGPARLSPRLRPTTIRLSTSSGTAK